MSVESREERQAAFLEAEAARLRERIANRPEPGLLEYPYCQVVGRNVAVLMTPEEVAFVLYAMRDYGDRHHQARAVEAEMWRAQNALRPVAPEKETRE